MTISGALWYLGCYLKRALAATPLKASSFSNAPELIFHVYHGERGHWTINYFSTQRFNLENRTQSNSMQHFSRKMLSYQYNNFVYHDWVRLNYCPLFYPCVPEVCTMHIVLIFKILVHTRGPHN